VRIFHPHYYVIETCKFVARVQAKNCNRMRSYRVDRGTRLHHAGCRPINHKDILGQLLKTCFLHNKREWLTLKKYQRAAGIQSKYVVPVDIADRCRGKDGGKESWRGDFKGIDQIVRMAVYSKPC
jgi:hypothetical protein